MIFAYIGIGLGVLLVILFLIAMINTIRIKDKTLNIEPLDINHDLADVYAKEFSQMIQVKTLSYEKDKDNIEPFNALHQVMKECFPKVHEALQQHVFEGGSLLFRWPGESSEKPIVLMAHQDVVPATKDGWEHDPFSGKVTEKDIHGRGTLDTKSTLFAFFRAVEELLDEGFKPSHDVYLSSSTDEEISGFGAEMAVAYLKSKNIEPWLVLDEGGAIVSGSLPSMQKPMAMIGVIEKGYCNIKFTAHSKGGHSSTPPKDTPIARLAAFINDVEKHFPMKTKMIPEVADIFKNAAPAMKGVYRFLFGNLWLFKGLLTRRLPAINPFGRALLSTTIAFTMQSGSEAANVIPDEAFVIANLRTHPIQDIKASFKVLEKIAKRYDILAEIIEGREASPISDTKNEAYRYLTDTIKRNYPDCLTSPYVMLGGTDCRFFSEITTSAYRFSPVRMSNAELGKIHGKNESITKSALYEAVQFYKDFLKNHK